MEALALVDTWPVEHCAVRVFGPGGEIARAGDLDRQVRWASVSKVVSAWAVLVAVEEGSIHLDEPAGPPGATVRHLLSHAAGCSFDGDEPASAPGLRRIYSNTAYDEVARHVEAATGMAFVTYLAEAVLQPLGMVDTSLEGSPAKDVRGTADDLARFTQELLRPTLLAPTTVTEAVTAQFPELEGIVPGVGRFDPCPWGLGPELKGDKHPHWMGSRVSAATFGHFGGSGTFVWVDPTLDLACMVLTQRGFDEWGMTHWPAFNNTLVDERMALVAR